MPCVCWEMVERRRPFEQLPSRFDVVEAIRRGDRPALSPGCPALLQSLIQRCWHQQAARQPTFRTVERYLRDELARVRRVQLWSSGQKPAAGGAGTGVLRGGIAEAMRSLSDSLFHRSPQPSPAPSPQPLPPKPTAPH